jgi:ABC-type lipoprotein export system ATPase subunit
VILDELGARARSGRSAVLLVTHSADLARAADRVVHLVEGRLASSSG